MFNEVIDAFLFPFSDKKWPLKILQGGVFSLSMFFIMGCTWMGKIGLIIGLVLIAALVFPMGYMFKILKDAIEGKKATLPEWKDLENYVKDGFIVFCIYLVYAIIFYLVAGLFILAMFSVHVLYPLLSLLNIVIAALMLFIPTLLMISICKYAQEGNIKAVLDLKGIFDEMKKNLGGYLVLVLILLGTKMLLFFMLGFPLHTIRLGSFPLASLLVPFVTFYLFLVVARLYGVFYAKKGK